MTSTKSAAEAAHRASLVKEQEDEEEVPVVRTRDGVDVAMAIATIGIFVILACAAVQTMQSILMPITLAIVVGMILALAADNLAELGLPPALGGLLMAAIFAVGMFFVVNALIEPISTLVVEAPGMIERSFERLTPFLSRYEWLNIGVGKSGQGQAIADAAMAHAGTVLGVVAGGLTPALFQILIFLAALGLFLAGRVRIRKALIMMFESREGRLSVIRTMNAIEHSLGFYFATASLIYGVLGIVTMLIAFAGGLAVAPLWGVFAFVSSFIPYLGVTLMTIALLIAGFLTHDNWLLALAPVTGYFLLHLIMENVITPSILGRRLEMNPFLIFVMIIFWTWMWGAVGAMLALPLSLIAMTIYHEMTEKPPARQLPS